MRLVDLGAVLLSVFLPVFGFSLRASAAEVLPVLSEWEFACAESMSPPSAGWQVIQSPSHPGLCSGSRAMWHRARVKAEDVFPSGTLFVEQSYMALRVLKNQDIVFSYEGRLLPSRHHLISMSKIKNDDVLFFRTETWANALGLRQNVMFVNPSFLTEYFIPIYGTRLIITALIFMAGIGAVLSFLFSGRSFVAFVFSIFCLLLSSFLAKFSEFNFLIYKNPSFWMWSNFIGTLFVGPSFFTLFRLVHGFKGKLTKASEAVFWFLGVCLLVIGLSTDRYFGAVFFATTGLVLAFILPCILVGAGRALNTRDPSAVFFSLGYVTLLCAVGLALLEEFGLLSTRYDVFFIGSSLLTLAFCFGLVLRFRTRALIAARDAAIVSTTQALAHDVRKPFSMFKNIIETVEATPDPGDVRQVLRLTLPEVNQAIASVEGMLLDVMQLGAKPTLLCEDCAPENLIESALGELFLVYPNADIHVSYDFSHRHSVLADPARVSRVFANILGNAVQAMGQKGSLWFRTAEKDSLVQFTIGNDGSHILPELLPNLFDTFFTFGKKGGTGLGLSIAKTIVKAHGGSIRCESAKSEKYPQGMVEFHFSLPVGRSAVVPCANVLPRSSRLPMEENVLPGMGAKPLSVALVDDSVTARVAWRTQIGKHTRFQVYPGSRELWDACDADPKFLAELNVVITDFNFAPEDPEDGGVVALALRERGFGGVILLASNETNLAPDVAVLFDGNLGKAVLSWPEFLAALAQARSARQDS
jgi:signal transduction histidine kinase